MSNNIFRIHPAIGIARVGNSEEFYLGPETMAGMEGAAGEPMGGLPIKNDQETQTIDSTDLRDNDGMLKRQAARFKIYSYAEADSMIYPCGKGDEIKIGSPITIDGETSNVASIKWQVHLANKKANSWIEPEGGDSTYVNPQTPVVRNATLGPIRMEPIPYPTEDEPQICTNSQAIFGQTDRLAELVIDAGPHVLPNGAASSVSFSNTGTNSSMNASGVITDFTYARQFPDYSTAVDPVPATEVIDSLGEMHTDAQGRLIVVGGYGKASGFEESSIEGKLIEYKADQDLDNAVNNDGWFDDTADGPVTAVLVLENGKTASVQGSAWVVTSDPSYAPQVPNVVSLWEDMYTAWVEKLKLEPSLYVAGNPTTQPADKAFALGTGYKDSYLPDYENQIRPILNSANLQMWATNLADPGDGSHEKVAAQPMNGEKWTSIMSFLRNPNMPADENNNDNPQNGRRMPLSLGDSVIDGDSGRNEDFLAFSRAQYFFMHQWLMNDKVKTGTTLGGGELLDRNILGNCLGGRFSPGIEMTFIIRDENLYQTWGEGGPFRMNMEPMVYTDNAKNPLKVGYTPNQNTAAVEPGDICKFMSIPWHTDYNSCGTHTAGNPDSNLTYWSWPAQRPVAVYTYEDLACVDNTADTPSFQRFSVRGDGTEVYTKIIPDSNPPVPYSTDPAALLTPSANVGRFQKYIDFVHNWTRVGVVIQGSRIVQTEAEKSRVSPASIEDKFLEVESQFVNDDSNKVMPTPIAANHNVAAPKAVCPHPAGQKK